MMHKHADTHTHPSDAAQIRFAAQHHAPPQDTHASATQQPLLSVQHTPNTTRCRDRHTHTHQCHGLRAPQSHNKHISSLDRHYSATTSTTVPQQALHSATVSEHQKASCSSSSALPVARHAPTAMAAALSAPPPNPSQATRSHTQPMPRPTHTAHPAQTHATPTHTHTRGAPHSAKGRQRRQRSQHRRHRGRQHVDHVVGQPGQLQPADALH